jgi:GT2 family glycosyltransferase/glycosyltransferase involved in cell wall biosynthesis
MVTRLLHTCGLDLGSELDLMPARADNPDGFWEHLRFVTINDEVLNKLGGAWDLPPSPDGDFKDAQLEPQRRKAQIQLERFAPSPRWGWKDPRNCLTLRFWLDLVPELKVLLVVRNPLEAAYSMRKRNGTSYSFALRLWEIYNSWLLAACPAEQLLVTHYDAFFENPEAELRRIAGFSDLPTIAISEAAATVTAEKRHTRFSIEQMIDTGVALPVVELYQALIAQSRERHASSIEHELPPQMLPGTLSRLNTSVPDAEDVRRELSWLRGAEIKLAQSEGQIFALKENIMRLEREAARVSQLTEVARKLSWFLQETEKAAVRLRSSRRWKISNPFAALRELLGGRKLTGYGHLDKVVSDYTSWRTAHPELRKIEERRTNHLSTKSATHSPNGSAAASFEPFAPTRPIRFSARENEVEVSIIIPVYNQLRFTLACLGSIEEHQQDQSFEVIVVDDGSTDDSMEKLGKIPGVVYLRNEKNDGFIASCNRGAAQARGKYLVFLNNDTLVTSGWLASLLGTFHLEPEAGLVGAKLIYPDGRLQEAGGIIWRDGSGWNCGKFDDPDEPAYNYLREVDYCSAACLMVPKALFEQVDRFDSRFAPGYYEDTDLAFKIRAAGKKVLYQPLSEVVHFEGATGGTDTSTGAKRYQEINRNTFQSKWAEALAARPAKGDIEALEQLGPGRKRILVIDHHMPTPDRDSGSVRMFAILTILRQLGHRLTFMPNNLADNVRYSDELKKRGIEVIVRPHVNSVRQYLQKHGRMLDAIILSRGGTARKHIADVRLLAPQGRVIFDTVDLHFVRTAREAAITRTAENMKRASETREQEYEIICNVDETWVVSETERQLLLPDLPDTKIEIVSNIVEVAEPKTPFSKRANVLFIGSFLHPPNVDAVLFYVNEVHPLVIQRLPQARFYIIGDKAPAELTSLADRTIIFTGGVPDVRPYFESVRLSVAPIRYGAGVKGKINQSMGLGVPVVATSVAVEGMSLIDSEDVLVADDPAQFAERVVEVYRSEEIWTHLSRNGLEKTKSLYSIESARRQLSRLFSDEHMSRTLPRAAVPLAR